MIRVEGVSKRFPGVQALADVNLEFLPGSCHALVGENGAGKSTLGKIIAGIYPPDSGRIHFNGLPVQFRGPREALDAGIAIVHQELAFCENMSVAENLALGRTPSRAGFLRRRELIERARRELEAIQASIAPERILGELTAGQQQMVQIASAVSRGARVLIFDEPTSSLSEIESQHLFSLIRRLLAQGVAAIYVSHRMAEIFQLCDTVSVLRDGRVIETRPAGQWNESALIETMIGRPFESYYPAHLGAAPGEELLRVEDLSSQGKFQSISFSLHAGEILGLAGLVGAGRTEIAQAIFGLDPLVRGRLWVRGKEIPLGHSRQAMSAGIGLAPEDRKRHGLVLSMNTRENISLPFLDRLARFGWVRRGAEKAMAREYFDRLRIRAPHLDTISAALSGGNQQKIVLAKWLAAQCGILLVDEPTRGVDVGAKAEIHCLLDEFVRQGAGVLVISSDLPEVINLSTRILVLRQGRIAGELTRAQATQPAILKLMAGFKSNS